MSWTQLLIDHLLTTTLALLAVWCATCFVKRPLVRHLLWVAVLIKFLLPPLVPSKVPWPGDSPPIPVAPAMAIPRPEQNASSLFPREEIIPPEPTSTRVEVETRAAPKRATVGTQNREVPAVSWPSMEQLLTTLLIAWGMGTFIVLLIAIRRVWRFQRLLNRTATHDFALQAEVDELARGAGLKRPPKILLTSAAVSPMLWAVFRPTLIFPEELWRTLPAAERGTLLLHELSHLARRDHWVRKLELLVTLIWWWHPGVWLARRKLHIAEEECCDAWVVARSADSRRHYADALLATLDFLADPHPMLPPVACGIGRISRLERRLTMILHRPILRLGFVARGFLAVAILGILGTSLTLALDGNVDSKDKDDKATTNSDEAAGGFDSDWTPPENPDPQTILYEADEDRRAGRYKQALEKHLWYHRHALEYDEGQTGVRLSFALSDWFELGEKYPPALVAFKNVRDETKQRIYREKGAHATFEDFHDLKSMNEKLGEEKETVKAFRYLHKHNPDAAERVYHVAEPALIRAKQYKLCGKYLTPGKTWRLLVYTYGNDREMAEDPKFSKRYLRWANKNFINETATLVALLVVNNRKDEAKEIAKKARQQPVSEDFQEQFAKELEQALAGKVPTPWP